jgi:hypothetical protein
MFISDLNYLEVASEAVVGGSRRRGGGDSAKIVVFQSNYNDTDQDAYAKAYSFKYAKAEAENYNETYQSNYIGEIEVEF